MKRLLIAVAIPEEFRVVTRLLETVQISKEQFPRAQGEIQGCPVEVIMTSMGREGAKQVANQHIHAGSHVGVLVTGYCGGLSPTLKVGDVVVAPRVYRAGEPKSIGLDSNLCETLSRVLITNKVAFHVAAMLTEDRIVETPAQKQKLFEEGLAMAVDMEAYEIVAAAHKKDVKAAVVKSVIDDAATEAPKPHEFLKLSQCVKKANMVLEKTLPSMVEVLTSYWV